MARIAGVDLPRDKAVYYSIQSIFGIGPKFAAELLEKTGIDPTVRVRDLSEDQVGHLRAAIDADYQWKATFDVKFIRIFAD